MMVQTRFADANLLSNICIAETIESALLHQLLCGRKYVFFCIHAGTIDYLLIGCKEQIDSYLDISHANLDVSPRPLAFLATDVASSDPKARQAYTEVYKGLVKLFDNHRPKRMAKSDPDSNLAIAALMIGGVAVSRALHDKALVKKLLKSCRTVAHQLAQRR